MTKGIRRRLAAIVSADVVGYSRLMGEDEAGTLTALRQLRTELFAPTVDDHNGKIVKSMGDGWLVEFASVIDAVTCAIEVQERLVGNAIVKLRIGVHLGDITHEDEDIYGDGVNIAARLQEIAKPGAMVISDIAWRSIDGKLSADFADLGVQSLKNIAKPVTAYGWGMTAVAAEPAATPTSGKPSIAVLPFDNLSGDPEQEYFSDGIAEDIITTLSRFHQFFVIARNSSFTYKGRAVEVKQVARELGVQYVIEGSVRRAGQRVRISVRLIDAGSGHHLWAERYDRELDDIFAVQDDITERIAKAVGPELDSAEMARARRRNASDLGVWELVARANWHMFKYTEEDNAEAQSVLSEALKLDPDNARIHTALSAAYLLDGFSGWRRPPTESRSKSLEMAQKAVDLDKDDELAHAYLGSALAISKRHEEATQRFRTAVKLNPNSSSALGGLGIVLVYTHKHDEGLELLHNAMQLSPKDPVLPFYIATIGFHHFIEERYDEARMWAEKALHENPRLCQVNRIHYENSAIR